MNRDAQYLHQTILNRLQAAGLLFFTLLTSLMMLWPVREAGNAWLSITRPG